MITVYHKHGLETSENTTHDPIFALLVNSINEEGLNPIPNKDYRLKNPSWYEEVNEKFEVLYNEAKKQVTIEMKNGKPVLYYKDNYVYLYMVKLLDAYKRYNNLEQYNGEN